MANLYYQGNGNEGNYVNPTLDLLDFANVRNPATGNNFQTQFNAPVPSDIQKKYPGIVNKYHWDSVPIGSPVYDPMTGRVFAKPAPKDNSFGSVLGGMIKDAPSMAASWAKDFGPVLAAAYVGGQFPGTGAGIGEATGASTATAMTPYELAGGSTVGAGVDASMGLGNLTDLASGAVTGSYPASSLYPAMTSMGSTAGIGTLASGMGAATAATGTAASSTPTLTNLATAAPGSVISPGGPGLAPEIAGAPQIAAGGAAPTGVLSAAANLGSAAMGTKSAWDVISTVAPLVSGYMSGKAAEKAAGIQAEVSREQVAAQEKALAQVRGDLQPFREAGVAQIPGLSNDVSNLSALTNDPNKQVDFIKGNPFFKLLADDAQSRLFANQAAKGKVGSGGTAQALQNSILLLGQDLLNQDVARKNTAIGNRFNLTSLGENAAAMQGTATQNTANNITNLATGSANAQAAGVVGSANAKTTGVNNAINTGLNLRALDIMQL